MVANENGWVKLRPLAGGAGLSFHHEDEYQRPTWPSRAGSQLMMMHLDIAVDDLDAGVAWASELGATLAEHQPQPHVRVMLDPDGHPFCLFRGGPRSEFDVADWNGVDIRS
jgi:Glyoxalase-like domain